MTAGHTKPGRQPPWMSAWLWKLGCGAVLCVILFLGLWPFSQPRNAVRWVRDQDGLRFGDRGTIRSSGTFQMTASPEQASSSLEIWLEPELISDSNTILAFSKPENLPQFSVHQYRSSLFVTHHVENEQPPSETIGIENVFHQGRPVFVAMASGPQGTALYVDGVLAETFSRFRFRKDLAGQLEIGTSPHDNDPWHGTIRGLAIYYRELTAAQVRRHFETWTRYKRPEIGKDEQATAVYLFTERAGRTVHSAVDPAVNLDIPERYSLLKQTRFEPFWKEYRPGPAQWMDVLVNVGGFVPLGFVFCGYLSSIRGARRPLLLTTVVGFVISLTIEFLQSYLPTRNSGTTDLFTNSLGSFLGARVYTSGLVARLVLKRR
jgi:VanZ family protein